MRELWQAVEKGFGTAGDLRIDALRRLFEIGARPAAKASETLGSRFANLKLLIAKLADQLLNNKFDIKKYIEGVSKAKPFF